MIVIAKNLVPGDGAIESDGLIRLLIVDGRRAQMRAAARPDDLPVDDIEIPAQFVVLRAVARVAQRDAKVKRLPLVQHVNRLDGGIQNMRRVQHHRRINGCLFAGVGWVLLLQVNQLIGRFLVRDVDVRDGKEMQQAVDPGARCGRRCIGRRHNVKAWNRRQSRRKRVLSIAVFVICRNFAEFGQVEPGAGVRALWLRRQRERNHPLQRRRDIRRDSVFRELTMEDSRIQRVEACQVQSGYCAGGVFQKFSAASCREPMFHRHRGESCLPLLLSPSSFHDLNSCCDKVASVRRVFRMTEALLAANQN